MILQMDLLEFEEVAALDGIAGLRSQYLDGLLAPQELYLELLVRSGRFISIQSDEERIGYFILGKDGTLLEYYVVPASLNQVDVLLEVILHKYSIRRALCKSFDHTLLSCCAGFQKKVNVIGIHFRDYHQTTLPAPTGQVSARLATEKDAEHILAVNEEIFENDHEVPDYIQKKQIFIFENEKERIGFGIFAPVIPGRPHFDIGMLVERKYRRQGYGEYILGYLVEHCRKNGWRAIAGCAIENEASRRCLEKAGFVANYRLLEFIF